MLTIKNVNTLDGLTTLHLASHNDQDLDAKGLFLLPAVIDPHFSCGSPAKEHWPASVESAIKGGITTLIDIPSLDLACETKKDLTFKKKLIEKKLSELKIPLNYFLYGKGNSNRVDEIGLAKKLILGSILLFERDGRDLDHETWNRMFQLAAWEDFPIVINSKNENSWKAHDNTSETLLQKAIHYAERQNTRLYVLNVSNQHELDLIENARRRSLLVYAETTPQHLFPQDNTEADFLWEALNKGFIETIGSGYTADDMEGNKIRYNGEDYDFNNPIFFLPLLLTAHLRGKITIENIIRATRINLYDVFKIERKSQDVVLVDMDKEQIVERVHQGLVKEIKLKGWPVYTIIKGEVFSINGSKHHLKRVE